MATYTWDSDEDQEVIITRARTESNNAATDSIGAPNGLTQAQADAFIAAAQAEDPPRLVGVTVNIFNTNQNWVRTAIRQELRRTKQVQKDVDKRSYDTAVANATRNQKDQIAVLLGLAANTLE
jgi:hypothetical protein